MFSLFVFFFAGAVYPGVFPCTGRDNGDGRAEQIFWEFATKDHGGTRIRQEKGDVLYYEFDSPRSFLSYGSDL